MKRLGLECWSLKRVRTSLSIHTAVKLCQKVLLNNGSDYSGAAFESLSHQLSGKYRAV